jgi:hypothetical protein
LIQFELKIKVSGEKSGPETISEEVTWFVPEKVPGFTAFRVQDRDLEPHKSDSFT